MEYMSQRNFFSLYNILHKSCQVNLHGFILLRGSGSGFVSPLIIHCYHKIRFSFHLAFSFSTLSGFSQSHLVSASTADSDRWSNICFCLIIFCCPLISFVVWNVTFCSWTYWQQILKTQPHQLNSRCLGMAGVGWRSLETQKRVSMDG